MQEKRQEPYIEEDHFLVCFPDLLSYLSCISQISMSRDGATTSHIIQQSWESGSTDKAMGQLDGGSFSTEMSSSKSCLGLCKFDKN